MNLEPFQIATADAELDDLRRRLAQTRWPEPLEPGSWASGTDIAYLRELCTYWEEQFDWKAIEMRLNQWEQLTTEIDGQRIHLFHVRSAEPDARPLMLLHGWPSSFWEFSKVIGPLTAPVAHGGDARDAFHVVVPSLPGYAWSGPTNRGGWDVATMAEAMRQVMHRLGYEQYGVMGGDWGSLVASRMAMKSPENVKGLYLTLISLPPLDERDPTEEEMDLAAIHEQHLATEAAYIAVQVTKPQSLAVGLTDSPAGLAAWIVEKFQSWTDNDGDLESILDKDTILANITAYWLTNTALSSARMYRESILAGTAAPVSEFVKVPTGVGVFPKELYRGSRRQAEKLYNIVRWTEHERGGHFAALEQPDVFVSDIRAFFAGLR
ncbi:epoxide hydrolase family protein [Nocardia rhamnosiphila]|uniref:Epoxide hydrolase family protein n=1 Tax=Nocardia rhamnosiphila TaxID=426716 RepID=A0ABV2WYR8_9NOCA